MKAIEGLAVAALVFLTTSALSAPIPSYSFDRDRTQAASLDGATLDGNAYIFLNGGGTDPAPTVMAAVDSGARLLFSKFRDRSLAAPLSGVSLSGDVYVFVEGQGIDRVTFLVNGSVVRTERVAPFDLSGGEANKANALDTADLGVGRQQVTAQVKLGNGLTETLTAFFDVTGPTAGDPSGGITPGGGSDGSDGSVSAPATQTNIANSIVPIKGSDGRIDLRPGNKTVDMRGMFIRANNPKYPVVLRSSSDGARALGAKIQGQQSRSMHWHNMKSSYDGDGVLFKVASGKVFAQDLWLDNVMDGLSFPGVGSWEVRGVYARYIRDDFIENDTCKPGTVVDTLVDGTFMFLSMRPGKNDDSTCARGPIVIKDSLIRLQCMPFSHKQNNSCGASTGHGHLFKISDSGPIVDVSNTIFYVESFNVAGNRVMAFPSGSYHNVTLVWKGGGKYPATIPSGVTVTTDDAVWNNARAAWLSRRGCDLNGNDCAFLSRR